jgi:hypothetical protein
MNFTKDSLVEVALAHADKQIDITRTLVAIRFAKASETLTEIGIFSTVLLEECSFIILTSKESIIAPFPTIRSLGPTHGVIPACTTRGL